MTAMEEVAKMKKEIERLTITKARLQERLETEKAERDRLMEEAKKLGVPDPRKLAQWVEEKKKEYEAEKKRVVELLEGAEGGQ